MDRKEARVCVTCHSALTSGEHHCKYCKVSSLQLMESDVRGANCCFLRILLMNLVCPDKTFVQFYIFFICSHTVDSGI